MVEAHNGTSSNDAGTRSTEFKSSFTSARDLANGILEDTSKNCFPATLNCFEREQVEPIVSARIFVDGFGRTPVRKMSESTVF